MTCCYCRQDKKLIKAHIIPEGFFRRLREEQNPPMMLTNTAGEYPKKMPIGVYDKNILCDECEKIFGVWDEYAQQLLTDEPLHGEPILYHTVYRVACDGIRLHPAETVFHLIVIACLCI